MVYLLLFILISLAVFVYFNKQKIILKPDFVIDDAFLEDNVPFYSRLSNTDKVRFQDGINYFLTHTKITGVNTDITNEDKLLIAAGAIVPIFNFPGWRYNNLHEVLVYPNAFNHEFETANAPDRNIAGMVGSGYMEGKMLLSKPAILEAFKNNSDKQNTIIHEFVHLIDKADGDIDGVPNVLLEHQYVLPWLDMVHQELERIKEGHSDIDGYAYTGKQEFFAVVAEYFFERPDLLEQNHPELYHLFSEMFSSKGN